MTEDKKESGSVELKVEGVSLSIQYSSPNDFLNKCQTAINMCVNSSKLFLEPSNANKEKKEESPKKISKPKQEKKTEKREITMEELRAKATNCVDSGKQKETIALIADFGCESLSQLPEDRYLDLYKKLEAL